MFKFKKVINEIIENCSKINWDGYGAEAVSIEQKDMVIEFVKLLPKDIIIPLPSPSADGLIGLTWFNHSHKKELILEIDDDYNVIYNYYDDNKPSKLYGDENFKDRIISKDLIKILTENFKIGN